MCIINQILKKVNTRSGLKPPTGFKILFEILCVIHESEIIGF